MRIHGDGAETYDEDATHRHKVPRAVPMGGARSGEVGADIHTEECGRHIHETTGPTAVLKALLLSNGTYAAAIFNVLPTGTGRVGTIQEGEN